MSGVVSPGETLPAFDVHCSLLSLPLAMGTTEAIIPVGIPYIHLKPEWVETWRERLGDSQGRLRVGLAWAGSPAHRNDRNRSCRLETFRPIIETWVALHDRREISLVCRRGSRSRIIRAGLC